MDRHLLPCSVEVSFSPHAPRGIGRGQVTTQLCPALAPLCHLVCQWRIPISNSLQTRLRVLIYPRADNSCNTTFAPSLTSIYVKASALSSGTICSCVDAS